MFRTWCAGVGTMTIYPVHFQRKVVSKIEKVSGDIRRA